MERDSLNFRSMSVGKLFMKQFVPALLGMVSSALFIVVDGIFVGRGIGSDALAAVNIVAPLSMIAAGLGLMFGMGGSILASINLSRGKTRVAQINITQAFAVSTIISVIVILLVVVFPYATARLLGADAYLMEAAVEYLFWFSVFIPFMVLSVQLPFFVRLTKPNYAMWCMLLATVINIVLDYLFIFKFNWGLTGAAIATGIGEVIGVGLMLGYLFRRSVEVHFTRLKMSAKSIRLTLRNTVYMVKLGFSTFLSEATIAVMAITGNYVFMHYLGTDGVAAYSIVCYLFPIIFMVFNATVQSVQPIISYNYGCNQIQRSNQAMRMALLVAVTIGLLFFLFTLFFSGNVVTLFVPDIASNTWGYATTGLPLFAVDYIFFAINIVVIGYYTSIEKIKRATLLTLLRGILPVIFFFVLPLWLEVKGIWLAVGISDLLVTLFIVFLIFKDKRSGYGKSNC